MEDEEPSGRQEQAAVQQMGYRLHQRFDKVVGATEVDHAIERALRNFDGARVRSFIPILAERRAADDLRAAAALGPVRRAVDGFPEGGDRPELEMTP
ncbi:three-helix bundle dimerization domain-containing protein [Kitasatospora sp. NPDC004240]